MLDPAVPPSLRNTFNDLYRRLDALEREAAGIPPSARMIIPGQSLSQTISTDAPTWQTVFWADVPSVTAEYFSIKLTVGADTSVVGQVQMLLDGSPMTPILTFSSMPLTPYRWIGKHGMPLGFSSESKLELQIRKTGGPAGYVEVRTPSIVMGGTYSPQTWTLVP